MPEIKNRNKITGLAAASHTPFKRDGSLNLAAVEKQAEHLLKRGITTVFIGGTTGESHSLSVEERCQLVRRWFDVVRGASMQCIVHVGANCLADARALAAQAQQLGALAISALAPSYFKPRNLALLIECCADIAGAAPATPFYYYDIPVFTGVHFSMPEFLAQAPERIPTLAGIKFTQGDLMAYQFCLQANDGTFDLPWGVDECLLSALALGARGAVGSSYNFAAPIYHRLMKAFSRGDLATARREQFRAARLIQILAGYGYMAAAKAVMAMLGVDVGPARLPNSRLTPTQVRILRGELEELGFFDWIKPSGPSR